MQVTEILTDHTLMALELRGAPEYPIRFYLDLSLIHIFSMTLALAPPWRGPFRDPTAPAMAL